MDYQLCRTCGQNEGNSYLFDKNQKYQVSEKIAYCCPKITISEEDHLPAYICCTCEKELNITYQFILKCEAADRQLRYTLMNREEYKPKVEVKLEGACSSDNDIHNEDILDQCTTSDCKEDIVLIKVENHKSKKKTKESKKKTKFPKLTCNKCPLCEHKSASSSALDLHMRKHSGKRPFKCSNCAKDFKDKGNLRRHMKTHNTEQRSRDFMCESCGKGFYSKTDIKIHMRTHTGETPYVCTVCPAKFTQIGALIRHKKRHTGEKPYICATCGKSFCTKDEIKYHSVVHTDEKKYSCETCKLPFKYKNNLRKHMMMHSAPNSFVCNYCGRTFNQKGNLTNHINRLHSAKSGNCNICLKNVSDIEVHMWKHTGQRPLKCEYCTCSFYEMKALARHVNYRHKNTNKFKCSFEGCEMKFPAKTMLEFHTAKLHESGIPFPCDRCTRGFYRKNDLARHKIGTHKERLAKK